MKNKSTFDKLSATIQNDNQHGEYQPCLLKQGRIQLSLSYDLSSLEFIYLLKIIKLTF